MTTHETDLDRLVQAVRANPADAAQRLVYADALEEAGEDRLARIQRYAAGLGIYADVGGCTISDIVDAYLDHRLADFHGDEAVSVSIGCQVEDTVAGQRTTLPDRELNRTNDAVQEVHRVEIHLVVVLDDETLIPTYEIKVHENGGYPLEDEGPYVICSSRGDLPLGRLIEESETNQTTR